MSHPRLIQGGMGVAVSGWRLARAVSQLGHLGVVSGTAAALVLARRLQLGDPEGDVRRALAAFPVPEMARRCLDRYFIPGGKAPDAPFRQVSVPQLESCAEAESMTVLGAFVEVFLAREGHAGLVGINLLEKLQVSTLPSLFGALLAGVHYVLMGAGIPRQIPVILDALSVRQEARLRVDVADALPDEVHESVFDPGPYRGENPQPLLRPNFLAIISSTLLATVMATRTEGRVDGLIVENAMAGGHNAPPRGRLQLDEAGEPVYGPRDVPDLEKIRALGLPFWLAGQYGRPGGLAAAQELGAHGIQVGTAFAFCRESGMNPNYRKRVLALSREGKVRVKTNPASSPTGFPFKVVSLEGTLSEEEVYAHRERLCDLGYLRTVYRRPDGQIGYRCASEPIEDYIRKGGRREETAGRMCLCNGLLATVGLGQTRPSGDEPALLTAGLDAAHLAQWLPQGQDDYGAEDVVRQLMVNS